MELQQLRYVIAVAETGNFTRAAERCNVAQPSLSQQIIKLERELEHRLFHRLGRQAVLTESGKLFIDRARRILFDVDETAKELRDDPRSGRKIVIGAIPTVAPYLLPVLLERCRELLPDLEVGTYEDFKGYLIESVLNGELDLALVPMPVKDSRLSVETAFTEPLLLAVGRDHPLAKKPSVTIKDLEPENFILLGESSSLTQQIQRFCGDNDFKPRIGYRCAQVSTLKSLVSLGRGVAILPKVAQSADDTALVYKSLSGREPVREISIVRHVQRYQSKGATQFIALLKQVLRERTER
ncbi:MAG TPA: LysR family transcriptional regulator [Opitutaceae bacterium]|nr:LysR family transcriptional regulator [Opitutaceae bacterium]